MYPDTVNNLSLEEFEAIKKHPDFDYLVNNGIIRVLEPRKVKGNGDEVMTSATGSSFDYQPREAIEIIKKSCDPTFLNLSLLQEQQNHSEDKSRENVIKAIKLGKNIFNQPFKDE